MPIMNRFAEIETCVEVCAIVILDYCYCWPGSTGIKITPWPKFLVYTVLFSKAKVSVPGATNKLGE